ncbi:unnamed protein product [Pleuronectes platessa]|uniref:Uncharacterized protein n=1 Tax=Pleuronectes platessa TaxID=8262 RepID=A0A9N7UFX8_PLEPL|nr:unnamed protein product [Pleuronectes platessa]
MPPTSNWVSCIWKFQIKRVHVEECNRRLSWPQFSLRNSGLGMRAENIFRAEMVKAALQSANCLEQLRTSKRYREGRVMGKAYGDHVLENEPLHGERLYETHNLMEKVKKVN